jgi:hypothetical protein
MITAPQRALHSACVLAEQGLPCFPCADDKRPMTRHGFKDATTNVEELGDLWRLHPGTLIGVPTGQFAGLDVLDVDVRSGGGRWFAEHKKMLPPTRVHRTRSGGLHLFFAHQPGMRCSAGQVAPGVDVRADGGYVIWWPAAGCCVLSDAGPTRWPDWLRQSDKGEAPRLRRTVVPDEAALISLVRFVAGSREGERNSITYWAACRVGEMIASGLIRPDSAAAVITEAATRAGLPSAEAQRTVRSGIRASGGHGHA